jgi:hypothetical protein
LSQADSSYGRPGTDKAQQVRSAGPLKKFFLMAKSS